MQPAGGEKMTRWFSFTGVKKFPVRIKSLCLVFLALGSTWASNAQAGYFFNTKYQDSSNPQQAYSGLMSLHMIMQSYYSRVYNTLYNQPLQSTDDFLRIFTYDINFKIYLGLMRTANNGQSPNLPPDELFTRYLDEQASWCSNVIKNPLQFQCYTAVALREVFKYMPPKVAQALANGAFDSSYYNAMNTDIGLRTQIDNIFAQVKNNKLDDILKLYFNSGVIQYSTRSPSW